ncbi:MAG: hypothetical protein WB763_24095 [Terriglobia bacterium]
MPNLDSIVAATTARACGRTPFGPLAEAVGTSAAPPAKTFVMEIGTGRGIAPPPSS